MEVQDVQRGGEPYQSLELTEISDAAIDVVSSSAKAKILNEDSFFYDVCLVFKVGDPAKTITAKVKTGTRTEDGEKIKQKEHLKERDHFTDRCCKVIKRIKKAGLKHYMYKSIQEDEVYMLVGATEARLKLEADRLEYELRLCPDACIKRGMELEPKLPLAVLTVDSEETTAVFTRDGWKDLYAPYRLPDETNPNRDALYQRYPEHEQGGSVFRAVDRIKLTTSILEADKVGNGAALKADTFIARSTDPLVAFFPLHDAANRLKLERHWMDVTRPWTVVVQPTTTRAAPIRGRAWCTHRTAPGRRS